MHGPKIYKRDASGGIRVWQYQVDQVSGCWRSQSGLLDGQLVTSGWTTCVPKSRDTAAAQALFEAEAEMGKKLDKDYALTIEGVDEPRDCGGKVMLAHKFEGFPVFSGAVFSQPKLDGMRCKVNRHGMWSRTGKPILSCPHIFASLAPAFINTPDLEIDGELYNHELRDNFNKLMSVLRKSKPTDADIAEAASVAQFHVYDLYRPGKNFGDRYRALELFVDNLGAPEIVLVPTVEVSGIEQLDTAYGSYLAAGYEGQIIRLDAEYERKRSKNLLKRKEFETAEFPLIAIEEGNGNWAGLAKKVRFRLPDGRECGGGIRGTAEQAKELLARPKPKVVTIRYFTPTLDGMPRFPVAIDFDRPDQVADAA
ncbi:hypothetical protein ASG32_08195 [Methylobacterium sp. Leaf361]|uniref:ATP-dependent DNA ligase n=1 Tax=Methylobacterium sp. Leaf361 TaxID=1736352 RepID=UPI0006F9675A|nr:hypothetical protein [Methylobacterium sp. Leaf361]KQS75068.1 hypothetical protein ASG32_08195 [Methylobacterium sp. Leaf361]